jgi:hypothetical protein
MLVKDNIDDYGLDDWVGEFDEIYGGVNKDRSPEIIWMHAVEHASELHEDLRLGKYDNALSHIADLFCWLCGFVSSSNIIYGTNQSLLDIVISKFPRHCFYCKNNRNYSGTILAH